MVRNFYFEAYVDGRKTTLHGGPQSEYGEMRIDIFQRHRGKPKKTFSIVCACNEETGELRTTVYPQLTEYPILESMTERN